MYDVTKHLDLALSLVYRRIEAKGLPAYRVVRLRKLDLSEIDELIHSVGAWQDDGGHGKENV